jgi:hypothetical protein
VGYRHGKAGGGGPGHKFNERGLINMRVKEQGRQQTG